MSDSLYEAYKEALRMGHVALLRDRLDRALEAYSQAASLAPDRALPHASLGRVLLQLGRAQEAEAAFDRALSRAPGDEAALQGRVTARLAQGRRTEAADDLAAISLVQETAGRLVDACDTARRALELAESRDRRRLVERLVERLRTEGDDATIAALARALGVLEPSAAVLSGDHVAVTAAPKARPPDDPGTPDEPGAGGVAAADEGSELAADEGQAPATDADPGQLLEQAEIELAAGRPDAAKALFLAAATGYRNLDQYDAAIEACLPVLDFAPIDTDVHLALAELYIGRGWTVMAAEKLRLLERLAGITGDGEAARRIAALAESPDLRDGRSTATIA